MHPPTKQRPILFSGPMVRAILDGRKKQTRRFIKPQPVGADFHSPEWFSPCVVGRDGEQRPGPDTFGISQYDGEWSIKCPFGAPGNILWVRETWKAMDADWKVVEAPDDLDGTRWPHVSYRADHIDPNSDGPANPIKWRTPIHMPRWASRITLEIEAIHVERLHDISEADAIAEGCQCAGVPGSLTNRKAYAKLWESINGKGSWDSNPWVWVLEFNRI